MNAITFSFKCKAEMTYPEKRETKLLAVCVGMPREVIIAGKPVMTGIYKKPTEGRVRLRRHNLEGDGQADPDNHGGELKAAYAYPWEHYAFWAEKLGRDDLGPGKFGENFSVMGLSEESVIIGDIYRLGGAMVQVTDPRLPCFKLGHKLGDPAFPERFRAEGRLGFYMRVEQEGEVGAGDEIILLERGKCGISIRRLWELVYSEARDPETAARAAEHPLVCSSWRKKLLGST